MWLLEVGQAKRVIIEIVSQTEGEVQVVRGQKLTQFFKRIEIMTTKLDRKEHLFGTWKES